MLEFFNRLVASLLWIVLLAIFCLIALMPLQAVDTLQSALTQIEGQLLLWRNDSNTNFVIAQIAVAVSSVLLFGALILLELWPRRRRGV
ncbi:MAG: hypothetical protein KDD84_23030, partial [Caldilineaceae bacterium]|nr:hypothetical protein [Caldilineaceae bacterium]